jgi:hypothetical protein
MDSLEKYHIYCRAKLGYQVNDDNTVSHNVLFDTTLQYDSNRGHP